MPQLSPFALSLSKGAHRSFDKPARNDTWE